MIYLKTTMLNLIAFYDMIFTYM